MAEALVVVVSWNTRELLDRCLGSLKEDHDAGRARVVVVDNGSRDGSREMVRKDHVWATLVEPSANLGFGPAVNLAALGAVEPWIVAANADVRLHPGCLSALIERGEMESGAGLIAPRLVMPNGETQHSVHSFPSIHLGLAVNSGLVRVNSKLAERLLIEGSWNPKLAREIDWAHGALLAVRGEVFEALGGFDPEQWMYAEDIDLAWRVRQQGWSCFFEPAAVADHEVSAATSQAFGAGRERRHIAAAYRWMERRRGPSIARSYALIGIAGAAARWAIASVRALVGWRGSTRARAEARRWISLHAIGLRPADPALDPARPPAGVR